jgi:CRISPR-associated protein Cmr2
MERALKHILILSYGPIQAFISSARKTRDLKAGSELLVRVGSAISARLVELGAELVIPHAQGAKAANVITCLVEDPVEALRSAEEAGRKLLQDQWKEAKIPSQLIQDEGLALDQLKSLLEFHAGWAPYETSFPESMRKAEAGLAASKATRTFGPAPGGRAGQPKSSLDPRFDNILRLDPDGKVKQDYRKQLKRSETLDAASLLKRYSKTLSGQFPSTRDIQMAEKLDEARERGEEWLKQLESSISKFGLDEGPASVLAEDPDGITPEEAAELKGPPKKLQGPRPFYAILRADGDGMGEALRRLKTISEAKDFSRRLAEDFASKMEATTRAHHGSLIYAGGDDVLAFVPTAQAIPLALEVQRVFRAAMEGKMTLSIGLALVPVAMDLRTALEYAHQMEVKAKRGGKNALALGAQARSGEVSSVLLSFAEEGRPRPGDFSSILLAFEEQQFPRGYPYEIQTLAEEFRGLAKASLLPCEPRGLIQAEIKRITGRKKLSEGIKAEDVSDLGSWVATPTDLQSYAAMLKIAHFLTRGGEEA